MYCHKSAQQTQMVELSEHIYFEVSIADWQAFEKHCKENGIRTSTHIRNLIRGYIVSRRKVKPVKREGPMRIKQVRMPPALKEAFVARCGEESMSAVLRGLMKHPIAIAEAHGHLLTNPE